MRTGKLRLPCGLEPATALPGVEVTVSSCSNAPPAAVPPRSRPPTGSPVRRSPVTERQWTTGTPSPPPCAVRWHPASGPIRVASRWAIWPCSWRRRDRDRDHPLAPRRAAAAGGRPGGSELVVLRGTRPWSGGGLAAPGGAHGSKAGPAGPGYVCGARGKTAQIAFALGNRGTLVANDISNVRIKALQGNLDRLGIVNVTTTCSDAANWPAAGGRFDRILVDAPCSSEGTIRRNPSMLGRLDPGSPARLAPRQRALLRKAVQRLAPGGRIVYSTCTFAPEENELAVADVLAEYPGQIRLVPVAVPGLVSSPGLTEWEGRRLPDQLALCIRIWPHQNDSGGFFIAVLEKDPAADGEGPLPTGPELAPLEADGDEWLAGLSAKYGFAADAWADYRAHRQTRRGLHLMARPPSPCLASQRAAGPPSYQCAPTQTDDRRCHAPGSPGHPLLSGPDPGPTGPSSAPGDLRPDPAHLQPIPLGRSWRATGDMSWGSRCCIHPAWWRACFRAGGVGVRLGRVSRASSSRIPDTLPEVEPVLPRICPDMAKGRQGESASAGDRTDSRATRSRFPDERRISKKYSIWLPVHGVRQEETYEVIDADPQAL